MLDGSVWNMHGDGSGGGTLVLEGGGGRGESIGSVGGYSYEVGGMDAHILEGGQGGGLDVIDEFFNKDDSCWDDGGVNKMSVGAMDVRGVVNAGECGLDVRNRGVDVGHGQPGDCRRTADFPTAPEDQADDSATAPGKQDDEWFARQADRLREANEETRQRHLDALQPKSQVGLGWWQPDSLLPK